MSGGYITNNYKEVTSTTDSYDRHGGGGVAIDHSATMNMTGGYVTGNQSEDAAGGIFAGYRGNSNFRMIGGVIAGVLGLAALLIGIVGKKNGGKGVGGIITGVLAILLAVILTVTSIATFRELKIKAEESGTAPLVAKYFDDPTLGLIGAAMKIPQDEGTLQELTDQFNSLK